jgi:sialate O-acetylesterase
MEFYGAAWADAEGEAVLRITIEVPAALQGQDSKLSLLNPTDNYDTYFNGVRVGGMSGVGAEPPEAYAVQREYSIPADQIKPGKNVIAVRVWDLCGGSGFTFNAPKFLQLKLPKVLVKPAHMYHPD